MEKRTAILFFIGITLIILLFHTLDIRKIEDKLFEIPVVDLIFYLTILFILQIFIMLLSALKWRIVLRNSDVSVKNIIPAAFVGYLINNITPVGLAGGEPIRAYILYKMDNVDMPTSASSVIVDLFLEIFPLFLMILISIFIVISNGVPLFISFTLLLLMLILTILFLIVVSVAYKRTYSVTFLRIMTKIISVLPFFRRYTGRLRDEFDDITNRFNRAIKLHMLDNHVIVYGVTVSILVWGLRILRLYLSFMALGIKVSLTTVLVVETMVSAISFLPLLPGALGIWEWTSVELFSIISSCSDIYVNREFAAMGTIMNRIFFYLIPSIFGIVSALYLGMNISKITTDKNIK